MNATPGMEEADFFATAYMASGLMYPGYFTEEALKQYPDPNFPNATGIRLARKVGTGSAGNPLTDMVNDAWTESTRYTLNSDLILKQDLKFITEGLSFDAHVSLSTATKRISNTVSGGTAYPVWEIDWVAYDAGEKDIWINRTGGVEDVYVKPPIKETADSGIASGSLAYTFSMQAGLSYNRKFGHHNVTARIVYDQRQYNGSTAAPRRNQSAVGRLTYDYKMKYLFEANLGVTGSEQFAPKYRYGVFPSVAAGYNISKEKFWKKDLRVCSYAFRLAVWQSTPKCGCHW
jgi:hypothetical protein